jgi:hypothetical protein
MFDYLRSRITEPIPLRFLVVSWLDSRFNLLSYPEKLNHSTIEKPVYGYSVLHAATLARKLGYPSVSAIEFGVAGGNGLMALERHAEHVKAETGVHVSVYGFDTGAGMPPPTDYRDLPYMWQSGYFAMDAERLRARLKTAELILGPVEETVTRFCETKAPAPIGFISFDLDYYSSTMAALRLLEADHRFFLPRVVCYFDDISGDIDWAYNEFTGELLAINEFNDRHDDIKIGRVQGLRYTKRRIPRSWHEQVFVAHRFTHPDYGRPINAVTQKRLPE